jgi:hypothetical protein
MSTLQQHIAPIANLIAQLRELEGLREQVEKAEQARSPPPNLASAWPRRPENLLGAEGSAAPGNARAARFRAVAVPAEGNLRPRSEMEIPGFTTRKSDRIFTNQLFISTDQAG